MAAVATSDAAGESMSVLSRVERLDLMMSYLEEMKGSSNRYKCASTTSSGTATASDGGNSSSVNSSPTSSLEKRCRPIHDVVMETQVKGSLVERVDQLEERLLKLEEDIEKEKRRQVTSPRSRENSKKHKKGIKSLVKSCVRGDLKTKD